MLGEAGLPPWCEEPHSMSHSRPQWLNPGAILETEELSVGTRLNTGTNLKCHVLCPETLETPLLSSPKRRCSSCKRASAALSLLHVNATLGRPRGEDCVCRL